MKFRRPIGAVKDMKELEYVAALHQTVDDSNFMNGSIDDADIKAFLISRYGIDVSKEEVRQIILKGLAGGDDHDTCLDMVETVAILIIPLLVKVANRIKKNMVDDKDEMWESDDGVSLGDSSQDRLEPPPDIIEDVLKCILIDSAADEGSDLDSVSQKAPKLTPKLLKTIFIEFDEFDMLHEDDLIDQMIADATGGEEDAVLDLETFARGLTHDVQLYDTDNETRHSTILTDVFPGGFKKGNEINVDDDEEEACLELSSSSDIKKVNTFSQIDFAADNVVSRNHVVLMWLILVFSYFFYMSEVGTEFSVCNGAGFGCKVGNAILNWLQIMAKLVIVGTIVGSALSMGNGESDRNVVGPLIGIASVGLFVFFPAWYDMDTFVLVTDLKGVDDYAKFILVFFGCLLVLLQIRNLFVSFPCSKKFMATKSFFGDILLGSSGKASYLSKQTAIYKVNEMVRNAYNLHKNVSVEKAAGEDAEEIGKKKKNLLGAFGKKEDKSEEEMVEAAAGVTAKALAKQDAKEAKDEVKRINQAMKKKSTRERALENFSNIMDETEEVGGVTWAWKEYLNGNLQKSEGVWLSSRLIAANAIQFVAVLIIAAICIYIFVEGLDLLYPDVSIDYSATCFSNFIYEKCYFPFGNGYYTGIGICAGATLADPKCMDLFEEVPIDTPLLDKTCDTVDQAYQVMETFTPGNVTCDEAFGELSDIFQNQNYSGYIPSLENYTYCYNYVQDYELYPVVQGETKYNSCLDLNGAVDELITPVSLNNATLADAVDYCLRLYPSAEKNSICERSLWRSTEAIRTYEIKSEENGICGSVISICAPTTLGVPRATCIIGENNYQTFQFEGDGCKNYPEIKETMNFYEENIEPYLNQIDAIKPRKWTVQITAAFATITATLCSFATASVYIPSSIHTIMKFRSGVIPSLRDPNFLKYRAGLYNMGYMIGVMFWGLWATTSYLTIIVSGIVFLFSWHVSREFLLTFSAQIVGIMVTVLIKMFVCKIFIKIAYAGFYRKYPKAANIFNFSMECWYLGLTVGFIISRLIKIIVATGLYVGRVDRPVLADGLILDIDSLPRIYRQNLLSTDSHRHPFIELLGLMYLMKLRHKDNFGTESGAAWRLIFVIVLMPWLKKKRIEDKSYDADGDTRNKVGLLVDEIFGGVVATS